MTLLQPTDTPSRTGINNAITSEIANHASTTNVASQHYDSGWQVLTLRAGYQGQGETPRYRRIGDVVHIMGRIQPNPAGNFPVTAAVPVADLPAGFRPSLGLRMFAAVGALGPGGRLYYDTAGVVQLHVTVANNGNFSLSGSFAI